MSLGGVPYYFEKLDIKLSVSQNIETLCFGNQSIMNEEYDILFHSLFDSPEKHMSVVGALATSKKGLTRADIIKKTKLSNAGITTRIIKELELSSFIRSYRKYGKNQGRLLANSSIALYYSIIDL